MSEQLDTATLIAKDESLAVMFKPPIASARLFHKEGIGHPLSRVLPDKNTGMVRGLVYDRGVFGWNEAERETDFAEYCEKQAASLGYSVVNRLLDTREPVPMVEDT